MVAVNGTAASQFVVDHATGVVTFNAAAIPPAAAIITAGFEFDVAARFDTDQLKINLANFTAGDIPDIPVVEIRV